MTSSDNTGDWDPTLENGFSRCIACGIVFGAEDRDDDIRGEEHTPGIGGGVNYGYGPVFTADGAEYDHVGASPPGSALLHEECYRERETEAKAEANRSLEEYAGGKND